MVLGSSTQRFFLSGERARGSRPVSWKSLDTWSSVPITSWGVVNDGPVAGIQRAKLSCRRFSMSTGYMLGCCAMQEREKNMIEMKGKHRMTRNKSETETWRGAQQFPFYY